MITSCKTWTEALNISFLMFEFDLCIQLELNVTYNPGATTIKDPEDPATLHYYFDINAWDYTNLHISMQKLVQLKMNLYLRRKNVTNLSAKKRI